MPNLDIMTKSKPTATRASFLHSRWFWVALAVAIIFIFVPLFSPFAYFFWGISSFSDFLENSLGLSPNLADFIAIPFIFAYILVFPTAARWLFLPKRDPKSLTAALFALMFVFGSKPLLLSLFQTDFSPDGQAQKCYFFSGDQIEYIPQRRDGSCPVDTGTGKQSFKLTPDIAEQEERKLRPPKLIPLDNPFELVQRFRNGRPIEFFDPATGRPKVWFELNGAGRFEIFDNPGSSPTSGRKLLPVTMEVVNRIKKQIFSDYTYQINLRQREKLRIEQDSEKALQQNKNVLVPQPPAASVLDPLSRGLVTPRTAVGVPNAVVRDTFVYEPSGETTKPSAAQAPAQRKIPIETPYEGH